MSAARTLPLFAPSGDRNATRRPLAPPHATPEDMARKREVVMHLLPGAAQRGWVTRPSATPVQAIDALLPRIGRASWQLQAVLGPDPHDIELRLTAQAAGEGPLAMLALVSEGMTLDEARKALAALTREGR